MRRGGESPDGDPGGESGRRVQAESPGGEPWVEASGAWAGAADHHRPADERARECATIGSMSRFTSALLLPALTLTLTSSGACGGDTSQHSAAAPVPASTVEAQGKPAEGSAAGPGSAAAAQPGAEAAPRGAQAPPTKVPAAARVVAIGDVHGDLEATRTVLRLAGAIDDKDAWIGGELVVVQTGDQLDRGDGEREILELLQRIREEAPKTGGAVYILNGNHELMNAAGDLRYVTAGGMLDFTDVPGVDINDPRGQSVPPQMRGRFLSFMPGSVYGQRLAERNVIQQVGDTVFVHGGVLPEHVRYGIERINTETQAWLRGEGPPPEAVVADEQSPVWTRRYSDNPGPADCAVLEEALAALPAKRMVVGHTVHTEGITSACGGKVWLIDVGMASYYGGHPEALEIVGEEVRVLKPE